MNRRRFLAGAAAHAGAAAALTGTQQRRPNVLFILVDEWRAQATGYNGDTNVHTPALDRFERESVNFQNAVSGHPVCCAYRGSLMTGQFPLRNGVLINDVELKPNGVTLGEAFTRAGYRTGYIGKWHLYGSPDGKYGRRQAFVPPAKRFGFEYWKAFECSHNYNKSPYYEGNDQTMKYWQGYDAIAQTGDACSFIGQHAKAADPYFLMLSLGPPHAPYNTAPEKYQAMYSDREIQLRPNVPAEKREEATAILRGYYAHIAALDDCLGRLLATLDRTGAAGNTVVVFASDHGDMMRSQGLTTKLYPWDESIRVPFLLRYPAKYGKKGRRLNTPLNTPGHHAEPARRLWFYRCLSRSMEPTCPNSLPGRRSGRRRPRCSVCQCRPPNYANTVLRSIEACGPPAIHTRARFTGHGCCTTTSAIPTKSRTSAARTKPSRFSRGWTGN